ATVSAFSSCSLCLEPGALHSLPTRRSSDLLIDAVKGMPDDIEMCIGAGRAFMFCGNQAEFYRDIENVNRHQIKVAERKMKKAYRSEEHTSELQSRFDLVCRLLLEYKKEEIK